MRITLSERALATCLVVPTVIVVIMLAVVQYRWSDQVSSATSVRLADSLQMSMMSWHLNLFRNLSDICQQIGLSANSVGRRELEDTARRFQEQQASAEYPDLVSEVDLVASDVLLPAMRWNGMTHRFEPVRTTSRLNSLQEQLVRSSSTAMSATAMSPHSARPSEPAHTVSGLRDWRFAPELPGLLRPVVTNVSLFDRLSPSERTIAAWIVIPVDIDVMSRHLLPELSRRYFTGTDGLDYQVALVAGTNPRRVIYSSDPTFAAEDVRDADGRMNLFGRPVDETVGASIHVFHTPSQGMAPPIAVSTTWFSLLSDAPPADDWQLVVRHRRGGALGAFVAQTRRRDLAISFGLLLLLVLSMTVWIIVGSRAQRLARLQMNFVAAVSHDLRTPLTIIASAADNIAHGVVREQQQIAQYGTVIGSQARKLSELVDRVLLFASIRESSHRYSPQPIDVSEVIHTALETSAELIQASRVVVERDIESNLPSVTGDPVGLLQCLQNLIGNAVKYAGQQRWLGIRAALSKSESGPEIQVSICDHGIGIASSDLRHIFEPFYRSPSIADRIRGTGLGLAVARSVVEAMNGHLSVVSTPGEGSTFTLHIPCTEPGFGSARHAVTVQTASVSR
jgi:signal transduction histidine kinase